MFKPRFLPAAAVAATFLMLAGAAGAAETADAKRDFAALACKDVMRLSGNDRDIALAFAHGYVLGKKGTTQYDVDALAQVTDQFIDYCLDHPAENALQSFEKIAM
jgi:hypothetical protein